MENKIAKMRIPKELQKLEKTHKEHGIRCIPDQNAESNMTTNLIATIPGPKGSVYENAIFKVSIACGAQYPFQPPTFKFITPVFHPNIDSVGQICLDNLRMPPKGSYNPAITLESMLLSIQLLLGAPNPDDPLHHEAAELFRNNREEYNKRALEYVAKHCTVPAEQNVEELSDEESNHQVSNKKIKLNL